MRDGEEVAAYIERDVGGLAHVIFVFPYQNNGGYMGMGWLGWLHGAGDADVDVQRGRQRWAGKRS